VTKRDELERGLHRLGTDVVLRAGSRACLLDGLAREDAERDRDWEGCGELGQGSRDACARTSKWAVSPRIRQPSGTTASKRPDRASIATAGGSSKEPRPRTLRLSRLRRVRPPQRPGRVRGDLVVPARSDDRDARAGVSILSPRRSLPPVDTCRNLATHALPPGERVTDEVDPRLVASAWCRAPPPRPRPRLGDGRSAEGTDWAVPTAPVVAAPPPPPPASPTPSVQMPGHKRSPWAISFPAWANSAARRRPMRPRRHPLHPRHRHSHRRLSPSRRQRLRLQRHRRSPSPRRPTAACVHAAGVYASGSNTPRRSRRGAGPRSAAASAPMAAAMPTHVAKAVEAPAIPTKKEKAAKPKKEKAVKAGKPVKVESPGRRK